MVAARMQTYGQKLTAEQEVLIDLAEHRDRRLQPESATLRAQAASRVRCARVADTSTPRSVVNDEAHADRRAARQRRVAMVEGERSG